jgi:hypothetical protein
MPLSKVNSFLTAAANPKDTHSMLKAQGLQDCNPVPTPHIEGHDMSDMKTDEDISNLNTNQSVLGSCRFLANTIHPENAYNTGIAGQHAITVFS